MKFGQRKQQMLNTNVPKFYSSVMQHNFISLFGCMANIKPTNLSEVSWQFAYYHGVIYTHCKYSN